MANTLRIKRTTTSNRPTSLANAELAFIEGSQTLVYGTGTGGAGGTATSIIDIGGAGAFVTLATTQTLSGQKTFSSGPIIPTADIDTNTTQAASTAFVLGQAGSASPSMDGTAAVGTSKRYARQDHVHPTDTSRAPLASPTFTGVPAAPTAAVNTNTTQLATTAFVLGQAATTAPAALGAAAAQGSGTTFARADHVHILPLLSELRAPTADVTLNSRKITNLATPTLDTDAATKGYVDSVAQGLDIKPSCRVATTGPVGTTSNETTIGGAPMVVDGVTLAVGDRVLVKNQSTASLNGFYTVTVLGTGSTGTWTRASDGSGNNLSSGAFVFIEQGGTNGGTGWVLTTPNPIVMPQALTFAQFSGTGTYTAGHGLDLSGAVFSAKTASASRITVGASGIDLATVGTAGTYRSVTTDAYGRVTAGTNPTTLAGYGITDAQPQDATLTALAALTTAADKLIYATAADVFTTATLTAFGRSLIDDADAATARGTLQLGTIATQNASSVSITGGSITNLTTFDGVTLDGGSY